MLSQEPFTKICKIKTLNVAVIFQQRNEIWQSFFILKRLWSIAYRKEFMERIEKFQKIKYDI